MSNLTDGKKALAAGKFDIAEKKLLKALDAKPDDSELWWCMMLCRYGYRSDTELESGVKSQFRAAAEAGERAPETPFDSEYCKNALMYARDTKRRDRIEKLNAELSELWSELSGKRINLKVKETKPKSRGDILAREFYVAVVFAAAGAAIMIYGIGATHRLCMWLGLVALVTGAIAGAALMIMAKRSGKAIKAATALLITVFALAGLGIIIAGVVGAESKAVTAGAAILVMSVLFGLFAAITKARRNVSGPAASRSAGNSNARADYDRNNIKVRSAQRKKQSRASTTSPTTERKENEYQDTFD